MVSTNISLLTELLTAVKRSSDHLKLKDKGGSSADAGKDEAIIVFNRNAL